ncbi:RNA-binding protein [Trypanosoma brucei equiperdum]|uniref:RNA-binding protein n=1 Tax=Trypanosoma brucei equiperdum TaxID=630700 RepID=A0A3L6LF61_9TRYP|nr:RNA-binding protein [Trypanosoma brucei equiperdum]
MGRRMRHAATALEKGANAHAVVDTASTGGRNGHVFADHITSPPGRSFRVDSAPPPADVARNCFTYCGPDAGSDPQKRLHQQFKALPKEERQRIAAQSAEETDAIARTVHLRFLPTGMLQSELAALCAQCGEYLRVRICGNSTNTQNWIYGFVEFADRSGAAAMMRQSGLELPNGPGKPPLRLKCNAAKQPIVDRVFHDASPEGNVTCIFGSGNFANRTLKEAVDSYYNLKRKEGNMGAAQARMNNSSHSNNGNGSSGWSSKHNNNDNHHNHNHDHHHKNHHNNNNGGDGKDQRASLPPIITETHNWVEYTAPTSSLIDQGSPCNSVLGAESPPIASQQQPSPGCVDVPPVNDAKWPSSGNYLFDSPVYFLPCPSPVSNFGHGAYDVEFAGCKGKFSSLLGFAPKHNEFGTTPQLPQYATLQQLVDRARTLVLTAMGYAQVFVVTRERSHDAVGALRRLYELTAPCVTPQALNDFRKASSTASDEGMEMLQQRLLQLRLLACLLLSLLYSIKGDCEEMLQAVRNAVACCNVIPTVPLCRKGASVDAKRVETPAAPGDWFNVVGSREGGPSNSDNGNENENDEEETKSVVGFGQAPKEDTVPVFNPLAHVLDLFGDVSIDPEAGAEGRPPASAIGSATGVETAYHRCMRFHSYVLNVFLTIGFAMEDTQPVVARCVYVLVHRHAKELFGEAPPELERALQEGGIHHLRPVFLPELRHDTFVETFFTNFDVNSAGAAGEGMWFYLPPEHMVRTFGVDR